MAESPLALFFRVMSESQQKTFWEHLDDLRGSVVRCVAVVVVFAVVAFFFKDCMFSIILAPKYDDFVTYRFFNKLFAGAFSNFNVELINTGLAQQFLLHIKAAFSFGVMCASPYVIYKLFSFVSPALYAHARHSSCCARESAGLVEPVLQWWWGRARAESARRPPAGRSGSAAQAARDSETVSS